VSHKTYRPNEAGSKPAHGPSKAEVDALREQVSDLIGKKPEKAAIILTEWLRHAERAATNSVKKPTKKAG
jgi:hypothetical protein